MVVAAHPITNFTAGELSPLMEARMDLAQYANGCRLLKNFLVHPQGGIYRRGGTKHVASVKTSSKKTRLVPFEFSTTQAYILEFGENYIRFYKDQGQIVTQITTLPSCPVLHILRGRWPTLYSRMARISKRISKQPP